MFQLQAIDTGSVGLFDVIVIVVIVELVDDADPEGIGIGKAAEVYSCYVEVVGVAKVPFRLEDGVHLYQPFADKVPVPHVIKGCFPKAILAVLVTKGDGIGDMLQQIAIGYGLPYFTAMVLQVIAEGFQYGKNGLFPGRLV
jgi:hypothetical protein